MYSGVGLQTPRGSGTSERVQASKFVAKPQPSFAAAGVGWPHGRGNDAAAAGGVRKPNSDLLEHDRKRQVELRLLVLRDALEEQGYTEREIEERVAKARKAAETEAAEEGTAPLPGEGLMDTVSHNAAVRKEKQCDSEGCPWLDIDDMQKKGI